MSKLSAFLDRLAAKAAERAAQERAAKEGSNADALPDEAGGSLYGRKQYWEDRFADGVIGESSEKGELSNEWCAALMKWRRSFGSRSSACDGRI